VSAAASDAYAVDLSARRPHSRLPASPVQTPPVRTPLARREVTKREVVWALTLSLLLALGIVATLLLQTAMQGEARVVQREHARMSALQQQAEDLRRELAHDADPSVLAMRARALHMRPQSRPAFLPSAGRAHH